MKRKKQTTPLLSTLTLSMLCFSLAAAAGAHGVYKKYNTDGWSQPVIAVLMQGLASRDYPGNPSGSSANIPSANQPNADGLPVAVINPSDQAGSGSESGFAGQTNGAGGGSLQGGQPGNVPDGQPDSGAPGGTSGGQSGLTAPGGQTEPGTSDNQPGSGQPGSAGNGSGASQPNGSQPGSDNVRQPGSSQNGSDNAQQPGGSQNGSDNVQQPNGSQAGSNNAPQSGGSQNDSDNTRQPGGSQNGSDNTRQPGSSQNGSDNTRQPGGSQNGSNNAQQPGGSQNGSDNAQQPGGSQNGSNNAQQPGGSQAGSDNAQQPDGSGTALQPDAQRYEFTTVTQEYFDDALLIGDSRADGVALYSGWNNLTYYTEGGMTVYNMFQSKTAEVDGQKLTIEEALQKRTFGKIYLEIGINEMGTGNVDSFMEAYEAVVTRLRELQPDAILYLCGIMYVKQSKSESDPIFNNPNIQERNDRIAGLADGENIFYLDINELVTDETGNLNPDYTWDEVHLLGKYDSLWLDYFCSHGIVKE